MIEEGAQVIDVGGESTRPGAVSVSVDEEMARVVPVISFIAARFPSVFISVDTVKSDVARAALDAGASIINDVSAFRVDPAMASVAAASGAAVVLMHSRGGVADMASYTHAVYSDVVAEVTDALCDVRSSANESGIADDHIILDPGLGFSKRTEHSIALLAHLDRLAALGCAVMVGPSRKRFVGDVAGGLDVADRIDGTLAACCIAFERGARVFRVHDVDRVRRALAVSSAVKRAAADISSGASSGAV
jgi:dihydropteroate synthase